MDSPLKNKEPRQSKSKPRPKVTATTDPSSLPRITSNMVCAYPETESDSYFKTTRDLRMTPLGVHTPHQTQPILILDYLPEELVDPLNQTVLNNTYPYNKQSENSFKNNFYHFFMGVLSLSVLQTILSSNDLIGRRYPAYKYSFYSIFPAHVGVAISILLMPSMTKLFRNPNSRIILSLISSALLGDLMILYWHFFPESTLGNFFYLFEGNLGYPDLSHDQACALSFKLGGLQRPTPADNLIFC
jgi:hypothetical protein